MRTICLFLFASFFKRSPESDDYDDGSGAADDGGDENNEFHGR